MNDQHLRKLGERALAPETLMMGFGYDPFLSEGAIKPPLFQTSTFVFRSAEDGKRFFEVAYGLRDKGPDEALGLIYSRINNPNLEILEDRLAVWDGAEKALVFSTGMAAISAAVLSACRPGDVVLYTAPGYGGTEYLFDRILPRYGVGARPVDAAAPLEAQIAAIDEAIRTAADAGGRLAAVYVETPANPTNTLVDLAGLAAHLKTLPGEARPLLMVDNTFLGPLWQKPLQLGADLVLYSLTKYVGGHSDLIAGACMGRAEVMAQVGEMRTICGGVCDAHTAWLLLRSLETLKIRMERAASSAARIADHLRGHPRVQRVLTPGGPEADERQKAIFARQCAGAGATFGVELAGGEAEAFAVLNRLRLFKLAVSLGGTESLASHPSSTTHSDYSTEAKRRCGIDDNLIRLSVGLEDPYDLIADLDQALGS